jgi:hypothetical protein
MAIADRMAGQPASAGPVPTGPTGPGGAVPVVPAEAPADAVRPVTIEGSARLICGWACAEHRLYEVVGGWATSAVAPAAKIYFDACSQHHAWRQRLWDERRPGLPAQLVPSYERTATAVDALATLEGDVERLSAYCRVVLPRIVVGYRTWEGRCSVSSDRPVARALAFALADVMADWERGSGLLAGYLVGDGADEVSAAAANASRQVDQLLARQDLVPGG